MFALRRLRTWLILLPCGVVIGAAVLVVMVSTNRTEVRFKRVRLGMTRAEVEHIMGPPTFVDDRNQPEMVLDWVGYDGIFAVFIDSDRVTLKVTDPVKSRWERLQILWHRLMRRPRERKGVLFD